MRRLGFVFFVAALMLTFGVGPSWARVPDAFWVREEVNVEYGDIDLNSDAGAALLLSRIRLGARQACGGHEGSRSLSARVEARRCMRRAIADAVASVQSDRLQALHLGRTAPAYPDTAAVIEVSGDATRISVPYGGYNLATERGRRVVSRRLERAVRRVCAASFRISDEQRRCADDLLASGETEIALAVERQLAANAQPVDAAALPAPINVASATPDEVVGTDLLPAANALAHGVCAPRSVETAFAPGSGALSREGRNTLAHAIDGASVCRLATVTIAVPGADPLARRQASAIRALMAARGVPESLISIDLGAAGAPTVHMAFDGVATADDVDPEGMHAVAPPVS
jgi:UrcA family protein